MEYLLAIALGPVQEFIATARRTRDLYAGSRLLSEAAGAAASALVGEVKPQGLIFPAPESQEDLKVLGKAGIPNVLLVRVPPGKDPASLGEKALEAARDHLRRRAEAVFSKEPLRRRVKQEVALAQVEDLLEGYYAYVPLEGGYRQARERVMALLAARKNTRDFAPVAWGGPEYKSSLDGARESVLVGLEDALRLRLGLREGEYLSGPDLLKRGWGSETGFVSTLHMAAMPFLEGVRRAGKEEVLRQGLRELAGLAGEGARARVDHPALRDTPFRDWDVRLLYESRLEEFPDLAGSRERLEAAQRRLRALLQELGVGTPFPYYALLHADGDRMGEAINCQETPEAHRALSRKLALEFAQEVGPLVEGRGGGLVYSGGDDVLALLPLHNALRAAWALAERFRQVMAAFGAPGSAPSLSVGLAVVHQLEPLQDALELVRRAEKLAKEGWKGEAKRNALGVVYSPRSGAEVWARGRWDETPRLTQRLLRYADLLRAGEVPSRAAYELRQLVQEAKGFLSDEALVAEALRLLGRKEMRPQYREELKSWLRTGRDVERLATELILARPFAEAMELAGLPVESREVWDAH
ncbi:MULTISPECIES: type III-B CRISPR-associated protein Cas10/Cmr2 [Thermus]|jgi:CRISPR-associated protein Cmr2|uniref:CRISPR-associated protein n=1 Tax=Thermus brockianus TaxID=56956 RepID=A0A1J0LXX6_THEBO|nr:type III-B CRISPR-associated protein Cas10/Cmr2 [Thermus brockianus]APD10327.1 CRISPR-associated protein [Thermus brockianus]